MSDHTADDMHDRTHDQHTRRDFIYYATAGAGAVATGATAAYGINAMNPSADVLALAAIRVDVSGVTEGTQLTVLWQGKPVFIRYRTPQEIEESRVTPLRDLKDPVAENANLTGEAPATDANRALAAFEGSDVPEGAWLVQIGICTHLGCVPLGEAGDFGGWFCPCHGSHYDTAGRVRKGPAPRNLAIPVTQFIDPTTILLGEEA